MDIWGRPHPNVSPQPTSPYNTDNDGRLSRSVLRPLPLTAPPPPPRPPIVLVRFCLLSPSQSWYLALPITSIPTSLNIFPDGIINALTIHHNIPWVFISTQRPSWVIQSVVVIWRDVSSKPAETDLLGIEGEKMLEDVWALMAQRGWRDYVRVRYVVT
jgi:hypothetical protein